MEGASLDSGNGVEGTLLSQSTPADDSSAAARIEEKSTLKRNELVAHLTELGWTKEDAEAESHLWKMTAVMRASGTWLGAVDMTYKYHGNIFHNIVQYFNFGF